MNQDVLKALQDISDSLERTDMRKARLLVMQAQHMVRYGGPWSDYKLEADNALHDHD